mgnify:CR=1 FL=1
MMIDTDKEYKIIRKSVKALLKRYKELSEDIMHISEK